MNEYEQLRIHVRIRSGRFAKKGRTTELSSLCRSRRPIRGRWAPPNIQ